MSVLSPSFDKVYTIGDTPSTWSIIGSGVTTQVPACGYSQTLTSLTAPSFVTVTSGPDIAFSAYSRDLK